MHHKKEHMEHKEHKEKPKKKEHKKEHDGKHHMALKAKVASSAHHKKKK